MGFEIYLIYIEQLIGIFADSLMMEPLQYNFALILFYQGVRIFKALLDL